MKTCITPIGLAAALLASTPFMQAQTIEWASYNVSAGETEFSGNLNGGTFDITYSGPAYHFPDILFPNVKGEAPASAGCLHRLVRDFVE